MPISYESVHDETVKKRDGKAHPQAREEVARIARIFMMRKMHIVDQLSHPGILSFKMEDETM